MQAALIETLHMSLRHDTIRYVLVVRRDIHDKTRDNTEDAHRRWTVISCVCARVFYFSYIYIYVCVCVGRRKVRKTCAISSSHTMPIFVHTSRFVDALLQGGIRPRRQFR